MPTRTLVVGHSLLRTHMSDTPSHVSDCPADDKDEAGDSDRRWRSEVSLFESKNVQPFERASTGHPDEEHGGVQQVPREHHLGVCPVRGKWRNNGRLQH